MHSNLTAAMGVAAVMALPATALAQERVQRFDIPAQAAAEGLNEWARQAGVQVMFPYEVVQGQSTPAVRGDFTARQALDRLIAGLPLSVSSERGGTVTLRKAEAAEEVTAISEVVVTAQKRSEAMQDVPISVMAYSAQEIARVNANTLQDLERSTPNLTFGGTGRATGAIIGIRGISDFSRNIGIDARAAIYVDGVYVGRSYGADQDLLGVERVEVLRGPQGTLFGKDTEAGAISIVMRKPASEFGVEAVADLGNFNHRKLSARIDLPVNDRIAASLALSSTQRDGYLTNVANGQDINNIDRVAGRFALRVQATDDLELNFAVDGLKDKSRSTIGEDLDPKGVAPTPYTIASEADVGEQRKFWGASLTADWSLGDYTVTSISAYRKLSYSTLDDEDYLAVFIARSRDEERSTQFSQEIRIASPKTERYDWVVGGYFLDQRVRTDRNATGSAAFCGAIGGCAAPDANGEVFVTIPGEVTTRSIALFANGNLRFGEGWELTAGARLTNERKEIDYSSVDTIGLFQNVSHARDSREDTEFSPKIGVNYHLNDKVMFYATAARAFKGGGWNADFLPNLDRFAYQPEYATAFEAGVKSMWFENRLRANAAAFHTKFTDYQVFQFLPAGNTTIVSLTNAGEAITKGFEVELAAVPIRGLNLSASAAYTDAYYARFENAGGLGISYTGNQLFGSAKWKGFVSAEYKVPLGAYGDLVAYGDYSFTSRYYNGASNGPEFTVPGYEVFNGQLGFVADSGRWEVFLWGKNLADDVHLTSRTKAFLGTKRGVYAPPRMWGVKTRLRF